MAVIVTDMDMPKSCAECRRIDRVFCEDEQCNELCFEDGVVYYPDWVDERRHENCPLKSVEGLLGEIESFGYKEIDEDTTISAIVSVDDVVGKIKEYFGIEADKDGKK